MMIAKFVFATPSPSLFLFGKNIVHRYLNKKEIVTFSSTAINIIMKSHREKEELLDFESRYITVLPTDLLQSYFSLNRSMRVILIRSFK